MSIKLKTLIITNAVAIRLLDIAGNSGVLQHDVSSNQRDGVEGLSISHEHGEHGIQTMRADRISADYFNVTFTGHEDYLKHIGVEGWASSIETLFTYLGEVDRRLLGLTDEFVSVSGDDVLLFGTTDEVENLAPAVLLLDELLNQRESAPVLDAIDAAIDVVAEKLNDIVGPAAEEATRVVEGVVQDDEIHTEEAQADAPAGEEQAPQNVRFGTKLRRFIASPAGVATGVAVVTTLAVAGLALCLRKAGAEIEVPETTI